MGDTGFKNFLKVSSLILVFTLIVYSPTLIQNTKTKEVVNVIKDTFSPQSSNPNSATQEDPSKTEKVPLPPPSPTTQDSDTQEADNNEDEEESDDENNNGDNDENNEEDDEDSGGDSSDSDSDKDESNDLGDGNLDSDIYFIETDFESNSIPGFWHTQFARPGSGVIVTDITRNGNYALKLNVKHGDYAVQHDAIHGKSRAELSLREEYADEYPMDDRPIFYGWSMYLPEDYYFDQGITHDGFNILGQWYHRSDLANGETWEDWLNAHGGKGMPPSFQVRYEEQADGTTGLGLVWKPYPDTIAELIASKEINLGEWNDIIFEIKWSTDNDGYVKGWINGESFTNGKIHGRNMYNPTPKNLKLGLYRGPNVLSENNVYYDEIRIGGSYEEVDPSNY